MKLNRLTIAASVAVSLALTGCGPVKKLISGGKASGQVAATVDGDEITVLDVRRALGNASSRDPAIMKQAQQAALQQLIMRQLLVQHAKADKLNKSADYVTQVRTGEESLLAQLYERKVAASAQAPSRQDAESYVASNPGQFADRKVFVVEQLIAGPNKIDPARFKPLNTLDQVKALFDSEGIPYQETLSTIDTASTNPAMVAQIEKLPPTEVFVVRQRGVLVFNQIMLSKSLPFRGDMAVAFATNQLRQQKVQELVAQRLQTIRKNDEPKIVYNADFKPPPPKAGPAGAPAPAAPTAPAAAPATK